MNPIDERLEALSSMPEFLERASRRLGEAMARRPGPDGGFSLLEQVWHLADLEAEGFGERIRRLRAEHDPFLPDFDGARMARERQYSSRDLEGGMRRFRETRESNLRALQELAPAEWERTGVLEGYGPLSLRDLPVLMMEHDRSHRGEIEELTGMEKG